MKTNELRIGNYIMYADVICKVEGYSGGLLQTDGVYTNVSKFNPIRIDQKWLIKFGFEKDDHVDEIDGVLFVLFYLGDYIVEHWINEDMFKFTDDSNLKIIIQNVHQLQNLYFSLTGYELETTNVIEPGFHYCNDFKEPDGALFFCSICGKKL